MILLDVSVWEFQWAHSYSNLDICRVAALLGSPKSCDRNGKSLRKKNGKHSPASDDESARSPPPAAPGSGAGKSTRPNG